MKGGNQKIVNIADYRAVRGPMAVFNARGVETPEQRENLIAGIWRKPTGNKKRVDGNPSRFINLTGE